MLLCIDIGNTHTHLGYLAPGGRKAAVAVTDLPTGDLEEIAAAIPRLGDEVGPVQGIAFCSVVPAVTPRLHQLLAPWNVPLWQLTHEMDLGVPISYPYPAEIGRDRLANAAGTKAMGEPPAVVIDLGTAVTFDIISRRGGYEGGIITPGPALMTRYLHEHTAQLPMVDDVVTPVASAIGKSTVEAVRIGAVLGFTGAIQSCLDGVLRELAQAGEQDVRVLTAGGAAPIVSGRLRQRTIDVPDLALRGLAAAWALNHSDSGPARPAQDCSRVN